jgi:hypothetical protein
MALIQKRHFWFSPSVHGEIFSNMSVSVLGRIMGSSGSKGAFFAENRHLGQFSSSAAY